MVTGVTVAILLLPQMGQLNEEECSVPEISVAL